jgi:hypothetical protein
MKITHGKCMRYVEIGVLILSFAFMISFWGVAGIDPAWRLEVILEANPHRYIDYVDHILLYLILPLTIGVVFIVAGYMKKRRASTEILSLKPLSVIGGIFVVWGAIQLWGAYSSYNDVMGMTYQNIGPLVGYFAKIYATLAVAGTLWLVTGVFLTCSPVLNVVDNYLSHTNKPA